MAFGSRYSFLAIFFIAAILFGLLFLACGVAVAVLSLTGTHLSFQESAAFWFFSSPASRGMLESSIAAGIAVAGGFIAFVYLRHLFRKTGSAELFFVSIFFFSLLFEAFRMGIMLLFMTGTSPALGVVATRLVYSGRLAGLISLFIASLYALDLNYQKFEVVVGIAFLVAAFLAFSISFDRDVVLSSGLHKIGDEQGLFIITLALLLLTITDYFLAGYRSHSFYSAGAMFVILAGREMLFFSLDPVTLIIGIALLAGGGILLFRNMEHHFSWM